MIAWIGLTVACFVVVAWVFIFIEDHPVGFATLLADNPGPWIFVRRGSTFSAALS